MLRIRVAVVLALTLMAAACSKGNVAGGALPDDMSLGNPDAKVTVVEYASVGCPICGRWQQEVWPAFKAKYVDTGKVHYVFREMLVGQGVEFAIGGNGFLLARCAGKDKYFTVVDAIFRDQEQAFQTPRETLTNIARSVGMTDKQFDQCVNDKAQIQALNDRVERHNKRDGVDSTPTFVVNGKKLEPGYHPLEDLDAAIAAAQAGK
jgi:protein-disulfide isomerase